MFSILVFFILFSSCTKDDDSSSGLIEYPDTGFYGKNILNHNDTVFLCDIGPIYGDGEFNSMKAILLSSNSKLRIEIKGIRLAVYNNQGWNTNFSLHLYDDYIFEAENYVSADLQIHFCDEGIATIYIFENNDTIPTRTKSIKLIN